MKIAYISSFDATDITSYSGTGFYIPKKLEESGDEIQYIGNLSNLNSKLQKIKRKYYHFRGKKYLIERNPNILSKWARHIESKLSADTDLVLGYSSQPFARLITNKPMVFWADAVFGNMVDYYEVYSNLCAESIRDGNRMEKYSLNNVSLAIFSSEWAAEAAVKFYDIPDSKIRVIPYGANIEVNYDVERIIQNAKDKPSDTCNLLFLGVEWYRKGGDVAVKIVKKLNDKGFKTNLSIVGVDPGEEICKLDFVKAYGFISKSTDDGKKKLNEIIANSHFLILPTRADCTPIVFNEFNAHGIPVITTNEGGIPTIVHDKINGLLFSTNSEIEEYVDSIINIMSDKESYIKLSKSSFLEFNKRLNWKSSINKFHEVVNELL